MKHVRGRKAFTMIELIIVIVILGILAGIAIVGYGAVVDRAKDSKVTTTSQSFDREFQAIMAFAEGDTNSDIVAEIVAAGDVSFDSATAVSTASTAGAESAQLVIDGVTVCLELPTDAGQGWQDARLARAACTVVADA